MRVSMIIKWNDESIMLIQECKYDDEKQYGE